MSRRVLFNGATLYIPGAATKIDASQFEAVVLSGPGIVGLVGEAVGGKPREVQVLRGATAVKAFYGSGDIVEAAAIAADPSDDDNVPGGANTFVCYKVNNSAQATATLASRLVATAKEYGLRGNSVTVSIAAGTGDARIITIKGLDQFNTVQTEVSPELGGTAKMTIQYTGAGSACVLTLTATSLQVATTGGSANESFTLLYSDFPTLAEIIRFIDAIPTFTCTTSIVNANAFNPANLDQLTAADIMTAPTAIRSNIYDVVEWVNNNSAFITATYAFNTSPLTVTAETALSGGTRGTSDNTAWVNAFAAMAAVRCNQLVALASADAVTAQGTFTISSIAAALAAHCKLLSSTSGRSERQGWLGVSMTKTNLIALANSLNSEHVCLSGQKIKRLNTSTNTLAFMTEWSMAAALAGMRAAAPVGEPLTAKLLNCEGFSNDSSWSAASDTDAADLLLNGIIFLREEKNVGYRICKGITTYTKAENDAYMEESIVQIWKLVSYDLRRELERRFTGRPGTLDRVRTIPAVMAAVFELYRDSKAITDSNVNGVITKAYRNLSYSMAGDTVYANATFSPTPGINFVLNTLVLQPASFAGSVA